MACCSVCQTIDLPRLVQLYKYSHFDPEARKQVAVGFPHHKTYAALRESATSGCGSCALFFQASNADPKYPQKPGIGEDDEVKLYIESGDGYLARFVGASNDVVVTGLKVHVGPPGTNTISYHKKFDLWVDDDAPAELKKMVIPRAVHQADDISTVQNWLANCMGRHNACRITQTSDPIQGLQSETVALPTRVLDVGTADTSATPSLRLLETNGSKGMYLTLSHCWGTVPIATTTTANLDAHKASIPLASLPLNFQHAIHFTRRLGMRYLWIDSLCIIQDSAADWEVESSRMAEIYHHSLLTLSAANSAGATLGFLQPRTPATRRGARVEGAHQHTFYVGPPISNYDDDVEKGPLAQRGWTLQERVLSRRTLFFGADQSHWECQTNRFSESTPTVHQQVGDIAGGVSSFRSLFSLSTAGSQEAAASIQPKATLSNIFPQFPPLQTEVQFAKSLPKPAKEAEIYNLWYDVVGQFTKRSLTVGDDKLPALSGIVKVFHAALTAHGPSNQNGSQELYAAGLWAGDFERGLLWKNCGPTRAAQIKMRSPSWSWTSVDGPVQMARALEGQNCDIRDASCEIGQGGGKDPFGRVDFGRLKLTGRLGLVPVLERIGPDYGGSYIQTTAVLKDGRGREIGAGYLDEPSCAWDKKQDKVWCLPVMHPSGRNGIGGAGLGTMRVECLLLCEVPGTRHDEEGRRLFWRVGTATLSIMGSDMDQLIAPFQEFLAHAEETKILIV